MNILLINMGIPGSGKSSMSNYIKSKLTSHGLVCRICSADNYQTINGIYQWKANRVGFAHHQAKEECFNAILANEIAIYDNTNTKNKDFSEVLAFAKEHNVYVIGIRFIPSDFKKHFLRQKHSVPIEKLKQFAENLKNINISQFDKFYQINSSLPFEDNLLTYDKIIALILAKY